MIQLELNSDTISKCILGSFVETTVLRVPGELNCLIIDELDWISGGYKMYCLHA